MSHRNADVATAAASHPPSPATARASRHLVAVAPMAALVGFTILVAGVTFVLSFVGLRDYAIRVAGVPQLLAWLVPVGVDGLTLCAVAATFALRHAAWHVRLYAWSVFGVAIIASVAGNLSHAVARELTWQGQIGAAAWPSLLALASHLVIVTWRHVERRLDGDAVSHTPDQPPVAAPRQPTRAARGTATATPASLVVIARQSDAGAATSPTDVASHLGLAPERATLVRRVVAGEVSAGDVANRLGVSRRTIERDVAAARRGRHAGSATLERAQ